MITYEPCVVMAIFSRRIWFFETLNESFKELKKAQVRGEVILGAIAVPFKMTNHIMTAIFGNQKKLVKGGFTPFPMIAHGVSSIQEMGLKWKLAQKYFRWLYLSLL